MKRLIITLTTALTMLTMSAFDSMPAGELRSLTFRVSGGMMPFDHEYLHLRIDADGVRLLTVNGTSPGEEITFEVADSVFTRCRDIIEQTGLYKSKGYYKPEFIIHDAPSNNFSAKIVNPATGKYVYIEASGFYPREISKGINAVCDYLHPLVGDRKAMGHLDRVKDADVPSDLVFTDGSFAYTVAGGDISDLYRRCSAMIGEEDFHKPSWSSQYSKDNNGDYYLVVHCYGKEFHSVFVPERINPADPILPLMQGRYTAPDGRLWLITRDGMLKHGEQEAGTPVKFLPAEAGMTGKIVEMDGVVYRLMLTDDGLNLYRRTKRGKYAAEPLRLMMDVSADNEAGVPGRWHVAALYPLQHATLALLPRDVLNILVCEADARATSTFRDDETRQYFLSKSWYKPDRLERRNFATSDTEQVNARAAYFFFSKPNGEGYPYE